MDLIVGHRDFCPKCRGDLTAALRKHLHECTWMRVQARETLEHGQQVLQQASEAVKESQQLGDDAHVRAREAEATRQESRCVKRSQPPG